MTTLNEFLERAERGMKNEALKMPKAKWIESRIRKMLQAKAYDRMDDFFRKKKGISQIIKDMEKVSGKPTFGKKSSIGSLIGALKKLEDKGMDMMDAWDDAEDIFNSSKDWGKVFKELNPEWDDK
jgi:hypothetical protein